jgi:signal peptidase I
MESSMEKNDRINEVIESAVSQAADVSSDSGDAGTPPESPPADSKSAKRKAGWLVRDLFEWGEVLVSAVVIIVVVFTFMVRVTSVDGSSMNPTLFHQDQMLVTNFFYTPSRGDIVVVHAPDLFCSDKGGMGKDVIKRIIAVAGDTVRIDAYNSSDGRGIVYLNGEPLAFTDMDGNVVGFIDEDDRYTNFRENDYMVRGYTRARVLLEETIPAGHVFVLGDNRTNSVDSRLMVNGGHSQGAMGLVNVNHIAGRAFFRVAGCGGCDDARCDSPWSSAFDALGFVA